MTNLSAKYRALEGTYSGDVVSGLLLWTGDAFRRFFIQQTHGIGAAGRKGMTLIPFPWITQGKSEGLYGS